MDDRTLTRIISTLLERVAILGSWDVAEDVMRAWPEGVLGWMERSGLLVRSSNATGLVCDGCEEGCWVEPELHQDAAGVPVLLHACHLREDIGLLQYPPERLRAWRLSAEVLVNIVAQALLLAGPVTPVVDGRLWRMGERRLQGVVRTFWLACGHDASRDDSLRQRLTEPHSVLVIPYGALDVSCPVVPLTDVLEVEQAHLRIDEDALLRALGRKPKAHQVVGRIPMPSGARWTELTVRVVDNEHIEVILGTKKTRYPFSELGMVDHRKREPEPNAAWQMLLILAKNGGSLSWSDAGASAAARQHMKKLRAQLREAFGIEDDPITEYKRERRWRTKFHLSDWRER